jgi:hypothetical protein
MKWRRRKFGRRLTKFVENARAIKKKEEKE